ncbi:MAG: ribose 5-phosphate isomerase B [Pseudomonadota bacterium]
MSDKPIIACASDHAGLRLKTVLIEHVKELGHDVLDLGPHETQSVDYPDYGYKLASAVAGLEADIGIAVCGSGIGISMALNRHPAIRCALVTNGLMARLARQHNNANVIAFGDRLIGEDMAKDCVNAFLKAEFEGGRHKRRVDKLSAPTLQC